jgi:hypothetical protein
MKCPTKDRIQALMKDANRPLSRLMCQRLIAKFPGVILSTDQQWEVFNNIETFFRAATAIVTENLTTIVLTSMC